MPSVFIMFRENISKGFRLTERTGFAYRNFTKGHNSVKTVDKRTFIYLCTLSDDALYLHQVL